MDLLKPDPNSIDFTVDVPDQLSRINRFTGAPHSGGYSVAQHLVLGADALKAETGRNDVAFAFLLHDVHEYLFTDLTSPAEMMLIELAREHFGPKAGTIMRDTIQLAKRHLDRPIFEAAGMSYPLAEDIAAAVKVMDVRMLLTERNHLMRRPPHKWHDSVERHQTVRFAFGAIRVWPWPKAADEWRQRFELYRRRPAARLNPNT